MYDATINKKVVSKELLTYAGKVAKKVKKYDKGAGNYYGGLGLAVLADQLIEALVVKGIDEDMKKIINHQEMEKAEKKKAEAVKADIKKNRLDKKVFYLASSHDDCAEDHKKYQGKMYIDERWRDYDSDGRIKKYVNTHNIETIQWVMDRPAWFITRPNCRHYFVALKTEDVLKKSIGSLREENNTHTKEGDYDLQTPREATLKKYKEKLAELQALYAAHPTEKLKKMIDKIKMLIERYE